MPPPPISQRKPFALRLRVQRPSRSNGTGLEGSLRELHHPREAGATPVNTKKGRTDDSEYRGPEGGRQAQPDFEDGPGAATRLTRTTPTWTLGRRQEEHQTSTPSPAPPVATFCLT